MTVIYRVTAIYRAVIHVYRFDRNGPGKNVRRDPANPTRDPVLIPGGIPGGIGRIPGGILTGIMERLRWDPTRDPANLGWDPRRDPT